MQASQAKNETRLPRAVLRRSAAIADRLAARDAAGQETPDPAVTAATVPEEPPPEPATTAADTPPLPAPPAPPVAAAAEDPRDNDLGYWKQKAKSVTGRLAAAKQEHDAEVQVMSQQIRELQEEVAALKASKPPEPIDLGAYFTPEQVEELGEDQCRAILAASEKRSQDAVKQAVDAALKPLQAQQQREQKSTLQSRRHAFEDELAEQVPDYVAIDKNPDWLAWLEEEDEATGIVRGVALNSHVERLDAQKVARIFKAYLKQTVVVPQPPVAARGTGAGPSGEPPAATPASTRGPLTAQEKKAFFTRSALGKVSDRERAEFEARLKLGAGR
jgi:hypothetical protein